MKKIIITLLLFFGIGLSNQSYSQEASFSISKIAPLRISTNAVNDFTSIEFWQEKAGDTNIELITIAGRLLDNIPKSYDTWGWKTVEIDTRFFKAGVYFIRVNDKTEKLVIY